MARELHDGLAQMLAAITFQSEHARASLANGNTRAARVAAWGIRTSAATAFRFHCTPWSTPVPRP